MFAIWKTRKNGKAWYNMLDKILAKMSPEKDSPEQLLAKVDRYASDIKTCDGVEEIRRATVRSIARHNEMKTEAFENPNPETFETLMPFARYFANKTKEAAETVAEDRSTEMELWMRCDDHQQEYRHENFSLLMERSSCHVAIYPTMKVKDVVYAFSDAKAQWEFFYELVQWLPEQLREFGFEVFPNATYGRVDGWGPNRESITLTVRWGNDNFIKACEKLCDTAQAQAFIDGVPLEDVVA